jgi:recombination protein RecA
MAKSNNAAELALKHLSQFIIGDGNMEPDEFIPTGHFCLDFAINFGLDPTKADLNKIAGYDPEKPLGLPVGKLVEFFGPEGGGKSSLAYRVVGSAQRMGFEAAWIDAECSFSKSLALINGADPDRLIVVDTSANGLSAESILSLIEDLCVAEKMPPKKINGKVVQLDRPKVIVVDSLASLVPAEVQEAGFEKQHVGLLSRLLGQKIGRITQAVAKHKVLLIIINQVREKVGLNYGDPETTPGGHAIKHHYSVRLRINRRNSKEDMILRIDENSGQEILVAQRSSVRIKKNRFGKPIFDAIDIPIYFEAYFPDIEDIAFDTGRQLKLISVWKGIFSWGGIKVEGKKAFIDELKAQGRVAELIDVIKQTAEEAGTIVPPELHVYKAETSDEGMGERLSAGGEAGDSDACPKRPKKSGRKAGPKLPDN